MDGLYVTDFLQTLRQQRSLMRRQHIKFFGQRLELFRYHRRTYLADF